MSLGLMLAAVALGVAWATETQETIDARAEAVAQAALVPRPPLGGPKDFGASSEPAPLGSLRPIHTVTDVTVKSSVGDFSLVRYYSATEDTYRGSASNKAQPFGSMTTSTGATNVYWLHNLYSFIRERIRQCSPQDESGTCEPDTPYYEVRDTSGKLRQFDSCTPQGSATTCKTSSWDEPDVELEQGNGFVLRTPEGRYYYQNNLLSYVEAPQYNDASGSCQGPSAGPLTCRRRVTLSYVAPSVCQGTTVDSGVLFVDEAVTASGVKLKFNYDKVPKRGGAAGEYDCVLVSVSLIGTDGSPAQTMVQYQYADGQSALLSSASYPETNRTLTYEYSVQGQRAWVVKENGKLVLQKLLDTNQSYLLQDSGPDRTYSVTVGTGSSSSGGLCSPGTFGPEDYLNVSPCNSSQWQCFQEAQAPLGNGSGGTVRLDRDFRLKNYDGHGPLLMESSVHCGSTVGHCALGQNPAPGSCMAVTSSEWLWRVDKLNYDSLHHREVPGAARDSNGAWTVYQHEIPTSGGVQDRSVPPELRTILSGVSDGSGTGPLRAQNYAYTYGSKGHEQLVSSTSVGSVIAQGQVSDPTSTTYLSYDDNNRLKAVIKRGYTKVLSGTSWVLQERYVGTFFFTEHQCQGGKAADPLGRTLEVHGPCLVTGPSAEHCSGTGILPITRYTYYSSTELGNSANRLESKTVITSDNTTCANAKGLTTKYTAYDARGNVTASKDVDNDVQTTYVYEGERLKQSTTAGVTTEYGYDDGATHGDYILHPEGYYEVLCFRTGTPGAACVGGTLTDKLQWKAKSASPNGSTWTEKVVYTYQAGALASETYLDATGAVRHTRRYETDPLGRTTFSAWGSGAGSYASTALFDAEGNQKGLGLPYVTDSGASTPPPFCGGPNSSTSTVSNLCVRYAYDRLNRLMNMVEAASSTPNSSKTCIGYDGQGNVESMKTGCSDTTTQGDCSSCSQPELRYQHDDFGNLVSVTASWTDNGSGGAGTIWFEHDAAGNLVRRQTPAMAAGPNPARLEYTYDNLGRLTDVQQVSGASSETLLSMRYDASVATPPAGCPTPQGGKTLGRLQVRTDSFGDTWFQYDAWGRVTAMYMRRAEGAAQPRSLACNEPSPDEVPPNDAFVRQLTYTPDGRLVAETYPHGRTVRYLYYAAGSGQEDRVQSIEVDTYALDGTTGTLTATSRTLLRNVKWEPFGGLRAYEIVAPLATAGQEVASIEYLLGGDNTPATSCNASRPGSGDTSGHLRGLWVSGAALSSSETSRTGDIFRRTYTWKGDQLLREDTCALDNSSAEPQSILYDYDKRLQLKEVSRPSQHFSTRGGTVGRRLYSYDRRGNRLADSGVAGETEDCWDFQLTQGTGSQVDRLLQRQSLGTRCSTQNFCPGPSLYGHSFSYDRDGRARQKAWPADSGGASYTLSFEPDEDFDPSTPNHAAMGMVYRFVSMGGSTYEYFYDANGRRRLKRYPLGAEDEFFYDGDKLLEDRGNSSVLTATPDAYTLDEYLWLDGRPVALIKSKFDPSWNRQPDLTGDCVRNGESAPCGVYFLVTDYLAKPVLMLDSYRRVAGMAEYAPFGHINRVTYLGDTGHPYANNARSVLGYFNQPAPNASLRVQLRGRYALVDTESGNDYAYLSDQYANELMTVSGGSTRVSGQNQGPRITGWVEVPQQSGTGRVHARFSSNSSVAYKGVVLEGYEYRRFQQGASPVWTPLRFPGQYHDAETDLIENWNRYYDPSIGRYLGPEPKYMEPKWVVESMVAGRVPAPYAYAASNPLQFTDPDGLDVINIGNEDVAAKPDAVGDKLILVLADGKKVPIEVEDATVPIVVPAGAKLLGKQDGIGMKSRPGEVFKTSNDINVTVSEGGKIATEAAHSAELLASGTPLADVSFQMINEKVQEMRGGWKSEDWVMGATPEQGHRDWERLKDWTKNPKEKK